MIDTVLFDFDGTIMDTHQVIFQSWQHIFLQLTGNEGNEEEIVASFGEPLEKTIQRFFPRVPLEEAVEIYRAYHYQHFYRLIKLFEGMDQLLRQVKERGYATAIVTSRLRKSTLQGLEKYNLQSYVDVLVTAEDCRRHKPDPLPVEMALNQLDKKPKSALMIGDTVLDVKSGNQAGVTTVLVGWSQINQPETLRGKEKPDFIIDKPENLWTLPLLYR